ncbi:MAG: CinA family nicotinamide mononucleotide deamidase-related protein [Sphingobacteriia bacterium]|nr:MAG: CinA family nicotinamide mononucleotide deamidase-related protein [Sphingobacteriia bacterium]
MSAAQPLFTTIITIGDELLYGQVIDTNSAWMARLLNQSGILVKRRVAVADRWDDIWQALTEAPQQGQLVLITGGLGPTADDITKPLLCNYFGGKMVVHQPTLDHVKNIFENILKRPMIERNAKQAEVPDVCTVLMNQKGTAPGMWFEKDGVVYVSLPGVPMEMQWLMENEVMPRLLTHFKTGHVVHKTLITAGVGESFLAEKIKDFEASLPSDVKLAYLPNHGMVRLRLSAWGMDKAALENQLETLFQGLQVAVGEYLVAKADLPMEKIVGQLLLERNQTLATAESCTGGFMAHLLSKHPGSSAFFIGSVVSYSNRIKESELGVSHQDAITVGVVSEPVVRQMAEGIRQKFSTDYAIAVSGIMGPGGATPEKPVGTVWMAVSGPAGTQAQCIHLRFDRAKNIEWTALQAMNYLRQYIVEKS